MTMDAMQYIHLGIGTLRDRAGEEMGSEDGCYTTDCFGLWAFSGRAG